MHIADKRFRFQKVHAARVREILCVRFPDCFAPKGEAKRPLKVGIGFDIMLEMPELSSYSIASMLEDYCVGRRYCENMIEGAPRIALDGSEVGFVSALEADHALKRVEAWVRQEEKTKHSFNDPDCAE